MIAEREDAEHEARLIGLRLLGLQREGRAPLAAADFLRGTPIPAGSRLD